jgi:hypothetical protein
MVDLPHLQLLLLKEYWPRPHRFVFFGGKTYLQKKLHKTNRLSCTPSLSDASYAVAGGLKHPQPHWNGRFATIMVMAAPTLMCGDGAVPACAALVLVIWWFWMVGYGAEGRG